MNDQLERLHAILRAELPLVGQHVGVSPGSAEPFEGAMALGPLIFDPKVGLWVTVAVRELPNGRSSEGPILLFDPRGLTDPRGASYLRAWLSALRRIVERPTPPACALHVGSLDQRMPLDLVGTPSVGEYERALLDERWLGRFLPPGERTPRQRAYEKAPPTAVCGEDGIIDLDRLFLWVSRHAELGFADRRRDLALLEALPTEARVVFHLAAMEGMVWNGGLASFVLQAAAFAIEGADHALHQVGADGFRQLLQHAVAHAARYEDPKFLARDDPYCHERSASWRSSFSPPPDLDSSSELDGHEQGQSFFLLERELRPCLQRWAERNRVALLRPDDGEAYTGSHSTP